MSQLARPDDLRPGQLVSETRSRSSAGGHGLLDELRRLRFVQSRAISPTTMLRSANRAMLNAVQIAGPGR